MKKWKKMKFRPVRGTHDIYGDQILKYNEILKVVSHFANISHFNEIKTPIFEFSELFRKPLGEHSEVVLKEMYTFEDRNKESITLRPEYTTPMIRAAITNNLLDKLPLKIFGIGPMFRRERPQKGRYRQFNQINFETLGSEDPYSDVELIILANDILNKILPNENIQLNLNTLGDKNSLLLYKNALSKYFEDNSQNLSEDSKNKIKNNPLRILDSKDDNDIKISKSSPLIYEFISSESKAIYDQIKNNLKSLDIKFIENPYLVRGLDYYCNTVFEFKTSSLGSQDTILGGGRYDGLISTLGGPDIPGIGWAAGVERLILLMQNINNLNKSVHIAVANKNYIPHLLKLTNYLKKIEISYYWNFKYNIKKSLSNASQNKAKFVIIIGENEFNNQYFVIKNMLDGQQKEINLEDIKDYINDKS